VAGRSYLNVPKIEEDLEYVTQDFIKALKRGKLFALSIFIFLLFCHLKPKVSTANVKEILQNKPEQANNPFVTKRIPIQSAQAQRRWSISDPNRRILVTNQYLNVPPSPVKSSASFPKFERKDIYRSLSEEEFPKRADQRFSLTTHIIEGLPNRNNLILDPYDLTLPTNNNIMNNTFRLKRLSSRVVNKTNEGCMSLFFSQLNNTYTIMYSYNFI
jgi:hypothetical protein